METKNKNKRNTTDMTGEKEKDLSSKTNLEVKNAEDPKASEFSGIPGTGGEDKDLGTPGCRSRSCWNGRTRNKQQKEIRIEIN